MDDNIKKLVAENCSPNGAITENLHTDNMLYDMCNEVLEHITNTNAACMLMPKNRVLKLNHKLHITPQNIGIDSLNCTVEEACIESIRKVYNIDDEQPVNTFFASNLYFLDSSLCVLFQSDFPPLLATRNVQIFNMLKAAPDCTIYDVRGYLHDKGYDLKAGKANVVIPSPSDTGYKMMYQTIDLHDNSRCVAIPVVWYDKFVNDVNRVFTTTDCTATFCDDDEWTINRINIINSRENIEHDKAMRYLQQHPVRKLGKIQLVCGRTNSIYCEDIQKLNSIK